VGDVDATGRGTVYMLFSSLMFCFGDLDSWKLEGVLLFLGSIQKSGNE
jgi:hypothetical protein